MRFVRAVALCLALTAPWLAPAAAGSAGGCAAEAAGTAHAALVVGTGSRTLTYCVALDGSTVSGIHLVQLAGDQFGLQYRLGFGGEAVCQLDGVGSRGGDCFADYPDFWGYWHGDGAGGWSWAGSGAGSSSVDNGDVEGWTWGSGDTGVTHPAPPALGFDDVCTESPGPTSSPTPGGGSGGGDEDPHGQGDGGGGGADGGAGGGRSSAATSSPGEDPGSSKGGDGSRDAKGHDGGAPVTPAASVPAASQSPVTELASGVANEPSGGIPPGAFVALALVATLGGAGWITLRRRARSEHGASGGGR
jgi:hypothetical protein